MVIFDNKLNKIGDEFAVRNDGNQDHDGENRIAGDFQGDTFKSHKHNIQVGAYGIVYATQTVVSSGDNAVYSYYRYGRGDTHSKPTDEDTAKAIETNGGSETRPKNSAVYFYIKIN